VSELFHAATTRVAVPAEIAFAYLGDGLRQSDWALGSWDRVQIGEQLFRGRSLFDGSETYVRISTTPGALLVDYEVGPAPEQLQRVNASRVVPGPLLGWPETTCVVSLMKWRTSAQSDDVWDRLCAAFDAEIHMIKGRLERGF
jgi:hypothetical protein